MSDNDTIKELFNSGSIIVTPITGKGDVNRVYVVSKNDSQVVVRLNDEVEQARFNKEAWCLEEALKRDIPSPRLVRVGIKNNTAYMILSYVTGNNGKEIVKDKEKIWQIIGTYAKKINQISTIGFSENMIAPGNFSDTWERYLSYNIDSLCQSDRLLSLGTIDGKQSTLLKTRFLELKEKRFNFGLIHGDLSLENVIVEGDKVTLIDWGVAESTVVPHLEIIDLLQNQISDKDPFFASFLRGYGMSKEEYNSIKPEIETLTLLQAVDKFRWAIDRNPDQIENFSQRVKLLVEK